MCLREKQFLLLHPLFTVGVSFVQLLLLSLVLCTFFLFIVLLLAKLAVGLYRLGGVVVQNKSKYS